MRTACTEAIETSSTSETELILNMRSYHTLWMNVFCKNTAPVCELVGYSPEQIVLCGNMCRLGGEWSASVTHTSVMVVKMAFFSRQVKELGRRHVRGQDQRDGALSHNHTHKLVTLQKMSQSRTQTSSVLMTPYSTAVLAHAFNQSNFPNNITF